MLHFEIFFYIVKYHRNQAATEESLQAKMRERERDLNKCRAKNIQVCHSHIYPEHLMVRIVEVLLPIFIIILGLPMRYDRTRIEGEIFSGK